MIYCLLFYIRPPFVFILAACLCLQVSWCKFEVTVDSPQDIRVFSTPENTRVSTPSKITLEIPPVVVTAINLKTTINEKQNTNEIVSASVVCCNMVKVVYSAFLVFGFLAITLILLQIP